MKNPFKANSTAHHVLDELVALTASAVLAAGFAIGIALFALVLVILK